MPSLCTRAGEGRLVSVKLRYTIMLLQHTSSHQVTIIVCEADLYTLKLYVSPSVDKC